MDIKRRPKPRPTSKLDLADRQINVLKKKVLPYDPHLLKVDIKNPFNGGYPHELEHTPFARYEVKDLQYMTMISEGSRGIADAKGNWQDEINSRSPSIQAMRSNTATPNPSRESKGPLKKISIADYKNRQKTGIKTTPQSGSAPDNKRPINSRTTSQILAGAPMSRGPSFESNLEMKSNGASFTSASSEKSLPREIPRSSGQHLSASDAKHKLAPETNGHADPSRDSIQPKSANTDVPSQKFSQILQPREQLKHTLPPRPQSPPWKSIVRDATSEPRAPKRPLETSEARNTEKRSKLGHTGIPSSLRQDLPRKLDSHSEKRARSPARTQRAHTPPLPRKNAPSTKPADNSKSDKPVHIPPLLSPLPADLDNDPAPLSKTKVENSKRAASNTPTKSKLPADTIVVMEKPLKSSKPSKPPSKGDDSPLSTPPKSQSPPFVLPPLLSPTLPAVVEEELHRLQQKSVVVAQSSVEARHEKARLPDAPGVARKMPKSGSKASKAAAAPQAKESLIVKLKYKKRKATDIARILKLGGKPDKEFLRLERERLAKLDPPEEEDSEEDVPRTRTASKAPAKTPAPAPSIPKKRPVEEPRPAEPSAKRIKAPENLDIAKSRGPVEPAFKSPAPSAPSSQKPLLVTPKKGDALKSVAMRKVDSNDGNARTPQATSTSTPASAERPRTNGDSRLPFDAALQLTIKQLDEQALKLKRKMDEILQTKSRGLGNISEAQRILGFCVGLECIIMYMQVFSARERQNHRREFTAWRDGLKLWSFIDSGVRQYPILTALSAQIGAVSKEELGRAYTDMLKTEGRKPDFLEVVAANSMDRDRLWQQAHRTRHALEELGVKSVIGPWTSVGDVTSYAIDVLEKYAKSEKTGWRITA